MQRFERPPVVHGILESAKHGETGLNILKTVVELEDDGSNLQLLLERIPKIKIPFDLAIMLVRKIASKLSALRDFKHRSQGEYILIAAGDDEKFALNLAALVGSSAEGWPQELITLKRCGRWWGTRNGCGMEYLVGAIQKT